MKKPLSLLVLSLAAATAVAGQSRPATQATDARTRHIYVSVVDEKGNAVTGLTADDVTVREDGVSREVLSVSPATEPLDVILLVDDSQAATDAIPFIRDGLNRFVEKLQGKADIGIVTIGERPTSVVERTSNLDAVKKGINRIFARPGSGAYLLEGILEVTRGFQKREAERPVIVAITIEGVEFSNQNYERILKELHASGATLHVLAVGNPTGDLSDEQRNRNLVISEGTSQTGGRREQLLTNMAIPDALAKVAGELLNQYRVTYSRPDALIPPEKIQVSVTKPGLTARARTRAAQR